MLGQEERVSEYSIAWLHSHDPVLGDWVIKVFCLANVIILKVVWSVWAAQHSLKEQSQCV